MKLFRSMRLFLLAALLSVVPASSFAGVFISINIAPPVMPVYEQPICPEDGLMWTPGYWAYGDFGYYWVPGAWVPAPQPGFLWTPPYWGWESGHYLFHDGYWGEHVGYYGGVNYGFGYMGVGFAGGEWRGGRFAYNTAVMHVNTTVIHNTYVNTTIVHNTTIINNSHVAYSGGPGGVQHPITPEEKQFSSERHVAPTSVQSQHIQSAAKDPAAAVQHQPWQAGDGSRGSSYDGSGSYGSGASWSGSSPSAGVASRGSGCTSGPGIAARDAAGASGSGSSSGSGGSSGNAACASCPGTAPGNAAAS